MHKIGVGTSKSLYGGIKNFPIYGAIQDDSWDLTSGTAVIIFYDSVINIL